MFGIAVGYILCLFMGLINFQPVLDAPWFSLPNITTPEFKLEAILYLLPIAIAPAVEHVGGIMAISSVTGKDFIKKPPRSMEKKEKKDKRDLKKLKIYSPPKETSKK